MNTSHGNTESRAPFAAQRTAPVVRLRHARKAYSRGATTVDALADVSLTVRRGEFVAVMGASGCGKSSLLNILGTLDRLDAGSYELDGVAIESLDDDALSALRSRVMGSATGRITSRRSSPAGSSSASPSPAPW
jgi:predicted ABC-type transport system involved in lysophospholipase L1 biosynthesis ATPase subunit